MQDRDKAKHKQTLPRYKEKASNGNTQQVPPLGKDKNSRITGHRVNSVEFSSHNSPIEKNNQQDSLSNEVSPFRGLNQQKTIPLNFIEDLKIGLESEEKGLIDYETNGGQEHNEEWFQEANYSAIQRNNFNGKERYNGHFEETRNLSTPNLTDRKNENSEDLESPLAGFGYDFEDRKINKTLKIEKMKEKLKTSPNLQSKGKQEQIEKEKNRGRVENIDYNSEMNLLATQTAQTEGGGHLQQNRDTEIDALIELKEIQDKNSIIKLKQSKQGASPTLRQLNLDFASAIGSKATLMPPTKDEAKKMKLRLPNTQLITIQENENDISDIFKKFEIDYHGKLHLDDKRSRMLIINNLMAAKYQGEVKDDEFFMIVDKTQLEQIDDFTGRCIKIRQIIWKFKAHVNELAFFIITNKAFDAVSLFFIGMNSLQLATSDPTDNNPPPIQDIIDNTFLTFYTTEMCLKIIGMGFFLNKGAYLRDPWNILDFVIVSTGLLQVMLAGGSVDLSAMRTFRVLRPLKSISGIEGLRIIVSALLKSAKPLIESLIVLFFGYLIFSIIGLLLFMGVLKKQCVAIETGQTYMNPNHYYTCGGYVTCPDGFFCGKTNSNPNFEQTNFDNIFYAFITVFQSVTLEGWTTDMKWVQNAYTLQAWFFFCPLTFIIAFFLLQLTQAVISSKFGEEHEKGKHGPSKKSKRKKKELQDFDYLDETSKKKLMEEQSKSRLVILRKWKQIFFLKQQMRIMIRQYQERRRQEEYEKHLIKQQQFLERYGQTGFPGLSLQEQIDYGSILGYKQMITLEQESSSRQLLHSVRGQNDKNNHIDRQNSNKYLINQETITEDDNENYPEGDKGMKGRKLKIWQNQDIKGINKNMYEQARGNNQVEQIEEKRALKLGGIQGIQNAKINPLRTADSYNAQRGDLVINEDFFNQFINAELFEIEQKFSDNQLRELVSNMEGGEHFLKNLDQAVIEQELHSFSHISYTSHENGQINNRHHHQMGGDTISDDEDQHIASETNFLQINKQSTKNQMSIEEDFSITEEIIRKDQKEGSGGQDLVQKSESDEKQNKQEDTNLQEKTQKDDESENNLQNKKKKANKDNQSLATTAIQNGTVNDTNFTEKNPRKQKSTKVKPQEEDSRIKKKFIGTGSIFQRDFIPVEQSYLNNKFLVKEDVGENKKIYVRRDKIDFMKPSEDIFEFRDRQKKEQLQEQLKKESMDYLNNIKVKTYQRKCYFDTFHIVPSDDQKELLQTHQLDIYDVEKTLQKQYNKAFLSPLYVTGTLSLVIQSKKKDERRVNVRKLQNILQNEEKDNIYLMYIVKSYLPNHNFSRSYQKGNYVSERTQTINSQSAFNNQSSMSRILNKATTSLQKKQTMITNPSQLGTAKKFTMRGGHFNQFDTHDQTSAQKKKELNLMKKANKDQKFQKRLVLNKLQKDAMRSTLFRQIVIRRRNRRTPRAERGDREVSNILDESDIKESEEEDDPNKIDDDDEDANLDDFFLDFDCKTEIFRAKKTALQKKVSKVQWSGQDVLQEYDPKEAKRNIELLDDIRTWPTGKLRYLKYIQVHSKNFVMGSFMDNLMTLCVAINTICLAIDRYGIDDETQAFLTMANTVFTYVFLAEMFLKLIGLGIVKYLKDKLHYIDGTIVMLSMVEVFLSQGGGALSAFRSIRIFRTFRVLRITRLLRAMKDMTSIIQALIRSISSLMYLFLLMFLFIFIFALLGMQIYGGALNFDDNSDSYPGVPRQNYDSFYWAFQVSFQLLTQENWQIVLWDTLRSTVNPGLTMIYHIAWMTLGNQITLNLLMAIMLDSFNTDEAEEEKDEDEARKKHLEVMRNKEGEELILYFQESLGGDSQKPGGKKRKKKISKKDEILMDESFEVGDDFNINIIKKKKVMFEGNHCELSAYIFTKQNPLRRFLYFISNHHYFETIIQITILLSSIKLVVDGYTRDLPADSLFLVISDNMDLFFTVAFALESFIKALSLGLIMDKGSYLRESWSKLDFFIVTTSLIDASFSNVNIPVIKVLRLLRTLRPLRFISHNSDMKTVIVALIHSMAGIFYVAILLLMVWIMFAILAVNFFGGKMQMCSLDQYINFTPQECQRNGGIWYTWYFNYDNVLIALVSLFDIATIENWPDARNVVSDISGTETGPIRNNGTYYAYFFNAFILIGTYIFLNLLIGVIFIKFEEAQKEEKLSTLLDDKQFEWLDMLKMIVKAKPDLETTNVPNNKFRKVVHQFVTGVNENQKPGEQMPINKFEIVIMVTIVLNMFQMCCARENSTPAYEDGLSYVNYIFSGVFVIEMCLKFVAFGKSYFQSTSNIFDFAIVFASLLDVSMDFLPISVMKVLKVGPSLTKILRMLRVSRLFRLIKKYKGLNALVQTIIFSLPSLFNVFALFMLVYFIFAILGTFLFADVTTGNIIDEITNFWNFGRSMLTLIRASTGEDWNYIMQDLSYTTEAGCIQGKTCGSSFATLFFITFMFIQSFIMMNLYILVIVQQFQKYYLSKGNILEKFKDDLAKFKDMWTYFSREFHCLKMKDTKIIEFYNSMPSPLGMKGEDEKDIMKKVIMMDVQPDTDGCYYFNEILFKTMKRCYCNYPIKNKLLAFQEFSAYQRVLDIKEQVKRKQRENLRKQVMTSNPFLLKMYKHISFKLWFKKYKENLEKRQNDLQNGSGIISDPEEDVPYRENENEEYYYQTESDQSMSSDEQDEVQDNDQDDQLDEEEYEESESFIADMNGNDIKNISKKGKSEVVVEKLDNNKNLEKSYKIKQLQSERLKQDKFIKPNLVQRDKTSQNKLNVVVPLINQRRNSSFVRRVVTIRDVAADYKKQMEEANDSLIIEEGSSQNSQQQEGKRSAVKVKRRHSFQEKPQNTFDEKDEEK